MYIDVVPNRNSPPAILLREARREGENIRKVTLANLSHWPAPKVEALRRVLRGETLVAPTAAFTIERSLPHGHVAATLGTLRHLGLERLIATQPSRQRSLVVAMIVARLLAPCSKLATARGLLEPTSSLSGVLGIEDADEEELYAAMDWLLERQAAIEAKLAKRHLAEASLVLCDVTSTYFEGHSCPLARLGHPRDGRRDRPQIVFGLLTDGQGCPVAVEVFAGNTADPLTLAAQLGKLRDRFGLQQVVLVGDRGLLTAARLREELVPLGLEWITSLRAPSIRCLVEQGTLQLSLFDQQDLAEIRSPDYPEERLIVCRNPLLAAERARKREELLAATERELDKIVAATQRPRQPLRGKDRIGLRVGRVIERFKMRKHFRLQIDDGSFGYERHAAAIAAEAALDGLYVIRTNVPAERLAAEQAVEAYKSLSTVERAFRSFKSVELKVRPIYHHLEARVRAHILLCLLAYYVEWHMRQRLAPLLYDDDDPAAARAQRPSIVAPARRSAKALHKAATGRTQQGLVVHSFQGLLDQLATLCQNHVRPNLSGAPTFLQYTEPTLLQQEAFELLGVKHRL
jgi:hypothetical protein